MTPGRIAERKAKLAVWVREGLVKLGPTFIKIGQQFSTRVDVLSPEFVKELEKLQVCLHMHVILICIQTVTPGADFLRFFGHCLTLLC